MTFFLILANRKRYFTNFDAGRNVLLVLGAEGNIFYKFLNKLIGKQLFLILGAESDSLLI